MLQRLDAWIEALAAGRGDDLHRSWLSRCGMVGRRESFRWAGRTVTGRVLDLSPLEGLIVETDDGRRLPLPAAETTVLSGREAAP